MKSAELLKLVLAGRLIAVVEFRKTETDTVRRKAPKAGEQATMPMVKHTVLVNDESFEVTEFLPDGADLKAVKAPFERGQRVALEIEGMERSKYGNRIQGTFQGLMEP